MSDTTDNTDTTDTTDTTDEPTKDDLHERVQQLESTVEKLMPSRRDTLRMGVAGLVGAAGVGATSGAATASTGSAGQIGDVNNRPDVFADTVDANQLTGVSTGGIKTKTRAFLSSNSSANPVPFDAVTFDPDNNFDTSANEYTVPANGTYLFSFQVRLDGISSGSKASFTLRQNGNDLVLINENSDGGFQTVSATDIRSLSSGDSIDLANKLNRGLIGSETDTYLTVTQLE